MPDTSQPELIAYFLKFPSDKDAEAAIPDLKALGFAVNTAYTEAFAEEGEGWLVVKRADSDADVDAAEEALSEIAERHGGVYDGWEAGAS